MSSPVRHFDFIDSLRGLAILGVMAVHTAQWVQPSSELLQKVAAEGARGVQLFFVASALTIFLSIRSRSLEELSPVRNYLIRRFFRIAPLFYLGIVLWLLLDGFAPRYWAPNGIGVWTVVMTMTFLHGFHPETITSLVPGGWSIAVEMMFYLAAPLIFRRISSLRMGWMFFLVTLVINVVLSGAVKPYLLESYPPGQRYLAENFVFLWFFAQLPIFALGVVAYLGMPKQISPVGSRFRCYLMLGAVIALWASLIYFPHSNKLLPQHVQYGASFALLTLALATHPTRLLVNSAVRKLGKISFSLYIFHFVVLYVFANVLFRHGLPVQGNWGFFVAWSLVVFTSSAIGLFSYRHVERRGIAAGAFLIDRLEHRNAERTT